MCFFFEYLLMWSYSLGNLKIFIYKLYYYSEQMVFVWRQRPEHLETENQLGSQIVTVSLIPCIIFICFALSAFSWESLTFANFLSPSCFSLLPVWSFSGFFIELGYTWFAVHLMNPLLHYMQQSKFWSLGGIGHSSQNEVLVIMFS